MEKGSVTVRNLTKVLTAVEQEKMITALIDTLMKNRKLQAGIKEQVERCSPYPVRDKIEITLLDKDRVRKIGNPALSDWNKAQ